MPLAAAHARILSLVRYALPASLLDEGPGSPYIPRTVALAFEALGNESAGPGQTVEYRTRSPDKLVVNRRSMFGRTSEAFDVPLQGLIAEVFEAEIQLLAEARMREQITKERDLALTLEARGRLAAMVAHADEPSKARPT